MKVKHKVNDDDVTMDEWLDKWIKEMRTVDTWGWLEWDSCCFHNNVYRKHHSAVLPYNTKLTTRQAQSVGCYCFVSVSSVNLDDDDNKQQQQPKYR